MTSLRTMRGFSLIELLVIIVVIGILAGIAMQSMTASVEDLRRIKTEREMEMLSRAIVGDPSLVQNARRSDFGYVGDVGAFPPNLQALYQNPGLATWSGPYIPTTFAQDSTGFKTDEWGRAYTYSGGITITSTGSGATLTKKIADATSDYLRNRVTGTITDAAGATPGAIQVDSINLVVTYPNGAGSNATKTYHPLASGDFVLDSLPVGTHLFRAVYRPDNDTIQRYITVLPRNRSTFSYQFATTCLGGVVTPTCDSSGTITLRPMSPGRTGLSRHGAKPNWRCVREVTSDNNKTYVSRSGSYATDTYGMEDVTATTCRVASVAVYARAMKTSSGGTGSLRTVIRIGSTNYQGTEKTVTNIWAMYNDSWATNPATGTAWTWTDVNNLQAGVSLYSSSGSFSTRCTQVYVVVSYAP